MSSTDFWSKSVQLEGIANAKALRWGHAWVFGGNTQEARVVGSTLSQREGRRRQGKMEVIF